MPGRFYFSAPGTPFYDSVHYYDSRRWDDRNWTVERPHGEVASGAQPFDPGEPPRVRPNNAIVGSRDCIGNLADPGDGVASDRLVNGFIPRCFFPLPTPDSEFIAASAIRECSIQRMHARLMQFCYDDSRTDFQNLFRTVLGDAPVPWWIQRTGNFPRAAAFVHPDYTTVHIEGTSNFQQFATQAFTSLRTPTDVGAYSTLPLWNDAAYFVNDFLNAVGADATKPILLVGHSYGAAVACLLGAIYKRARPDRQVIALTFGVPKIGDERASALVGQVDAVHLCNDDDIVTVIPPDVLALAPFVPFLGGVLPIVFTTWIPVQNQFRLLPNGVLQFGAPDFPSFGVFLNVLLRALSFQSLNPITGHTIAEYYRRLAIRCPDVKWPVTIDTIIDETKPYVYPLLASGAVDLTGSAVFQSARTLLASGGVVVNGSAAFVGPPHPGTSCATAGTIPFATDIPGTADDVTGDWWKWDSRAGKNYTVTITVSAGMLGSATVSTGPCAALTTQFILFFAGSNNYNEPGPDEQGVCQVLASAISGTVGYTLRVDEA